MKITEMHITPIALGDPPLLNAAGLHAPYCLRTVVELVTDTGLRGLAEVPGSVAVDAALAEARSVVIGANPMNWHALRAKLAERCSPESSLARGDRPWDGRTRIQVFSAMDVACLDIQGHAYEQPVAMLLGGVVRERIPYSAYLFYKYEGAGGELAFGTDPEATGWAAARQKAALDPDGIVEQAQAMVKEFGFESIKLKGGCFEPAQEVAAMKALHERFGPDMPLRLHPNAVGAVAMSVKYGRELEGLLECLEYPCRSQEGMAAVRRSLKTPLATNMCTTSFDD